ncbi:T9SS type A sorting domain-containing protein [Ignavibacterium sp.]|uniref:T9SS type A sorting domain-containing protein n=1 Tax=Ignavibacterium sp. TaxID=2651167 RepID=UPI00307D127A
MVRIKNSSALLIQRIASSIGMNKMKILILLIVFTKIIISQDFQVSNNGAVVFGTHITSDSVGNIVIVWDDSRNIKIPYGGTGTEGDVYGQRYNKFGQPIGGNFRISDDSIDTDISYASQFLVRVAMNKKGEFVVTWVDTRTTQSKSNQSANFNIYAQRFDSGGNSIGNNFLVNDYITGGLTNPDIVIRDDGSFVIVWVNTLENNSIYMQSFDSSGSKIEQNKKLELYGKQTRLALFKNGDILVASDSTAQIWSFPSYQIKDSFDIPFGYTKEIAVNKKDEIFIVQMENRFTTNKFLDSDIFLYKYDTLGNNLNRIKVNDDFTDYWQTNPTISSNELYNFIAWQDYRNGYQIGDGDCQDIYGQRFRQNLNKIGFNFKISHENNGSVQFNPVTTLVNDSIYLAWLDGRSLESFPNVYPPQFKIDVWGTIQDFNHPIEGTIIRCYPPKFPDHTSVIFYPCYPNPTNSNVTFAYDLIEDSRIQLSIFNILGKEVKLLYSGFDTAGSYNRKFSITYLPSGVYFANLTVKNLNGGLQSHYIKVVLIK